MPPVSPTIRVLCVDDHPLMRSGIIRVLDQSSELTVVAEASNGEEAVAKFLEHRPDVTVMDLQLPRMSGLEAIRVIRELDADARIVVLTIYQAYEDIYQALSLGAIGYLLKDAVPDDLARVIVDAHRGTRAIPADIAMKLDAGQCQRMLTLREMQVLELLTKGMRNKELAARLGISLDTARVHIKNILAKLGVRDRTAALAEGLRRGLIHID